MPTPEESPKESESVEQIVHKLQRRAEEAERQNAALRAEFAKLKESNGTR